MACNFQSSLYLNFLAQSVGTCAYKYYYYINKKLFMPLVFASKCELPFLIFVFVSSTCTVTRKKINIGSRTQDFISINAPKCTWDILALIIYHYEWDLIIYLYFTFLLSTAGTSCGVVPWGTVRNIHCWRYKIFWFLWEISIFTLLASGSSCQRLITTPWTWSTVRLG